MPAHGLDGEARLFRTYTRQVSVVQTAVDQDRPHEYEAAFLDGLGRAVYDVTGLWPREHAGLPQLQFGGGEGL